MNYILTVAVFVIVAIGAGFLTWKETPQPINEQTSASKRTEDSNVNTSSPADSGRTLDLSGQGLTQVPSSIFDQSDVEVLNVSNNKLEGALQAEVRHLQNLRVLDLSDNNFTGVPAEVGQLTKLEVLDLSNNPITGLPYEIGNLKNLQVLDLRGTNYAQQDFDVIRQSLPSSVEIKID